MPARKKYHSDEERQEAKREASRKYRESHRDLAIARGAKYREENREKKRAADREYRAKYRAEHPEKVRAYTERWRAENAEKNRATVAAWGRANPEKVRAKAARRRARKLGSEPDLTLAQWAEILEEFDRRCAYCGTDGPMDQEHVVPLVRGGKHTKNNVVPACRSCNSSKGSKLLAEWRPVV